MLQNIEAKSISATKGAMSVGGVTGLRLYPTREVGKGKFILRFKSPETGKRRDMGLGLYPDISLKNIRMKALKLRELLDEGIDPIEQRKRDEAECKRSINTFEQAAYLVHEARASGFKNLKHAKQWITTLETYVFPTIGDRPVDELTVSDFNQAIKGIWLTKQETASRVLQRCDVVMGWCVAHQMIPYNPVPSVKFLLPRQESKQVRVRHHPAVPWLDVPNVCSLIFAPNAKSIGRDALKFLLLTATRSKETRGALWSEIDIENAIWTIPRDRMKTGLQHRVPLSLQAIDLLERCTIETKLPGNDLIFPSTKRTMLSDMTLTKVMRDHIIASDYPDRTATVHGFRSSFRDWASENGFARDLAERALAHTIKNSTEAAYHRTDLLEQRRDMTQQWADWCFGRMR